MNTISQSKPDELKRELHCARSALAYQKKAARTERGCSREEQIAQAEARVVSAKEAYRASIPEPTSLRVRSPYFIGPRRERGVRGDGPTIICFRCREEKPVAEFYKKGTVCKCCVVKRAAEWAEKNPEKVKVFKGAWAEENRGSTNEKARAKYWNDPEAARQRNRDNYDKDACNEYQKRYISARRKRDPAFRAFLNCKSRMHRLMESAGVKKKTRSAELIGLQRDQFLSYLESKWVDGMSWNNYGWGPGKWVIDHVIPARFFDHRLIDEQKKCWHFTNLAPMWWRNNLQKSDRLPCGNRARDKKILLTT